MRVLVRAQTLENLDGHRQRKLQLFQEANNAAGGSICEKIPALITEQARYLNSIMVDALREDVTRPIDIKAVRTEIERLIDYVDFKHFCAGETL